jgi:putative endonuclease
MVGGEMADKDELGRMGEVLAARYLEDRGYRILVRNWRCRRGELDIVAEHGHDTVFVEVKTRSALGYGHPFESVTPVKRARLRSLAVAWCSESDRRTANIRIDVVGVLLKPGRRPVIEHLSGAC